MASADFPNPGTMPASDDICSVTGSCEPAKLSAGPTPRRVQMDWNQLRPTGGERAVKRLLSTLSASFDGIVFLATTGSFGQLAKVYCSDEALATVKRLPPSISSGLIEAAASQSVIAHSSQQPGLSRVLPQLLKDLDGCTAIAITVQLVQSPARAGLLLVQRTPTSAEELSSTAELFAAIALETAPWLDAFLMCQSGQRIATWKRSLSNLRSKRASIVSTIVLFLIMALAIPAPYWPKRECVIEPATRQFIASPIAGRMEQALVKPGDTVTKGQLLANLHGDELRIELSSARAEHAAASKKKDSALATGAAGNLRIAQLEQQQIALRIESISEKLYRLEVRSPIDGVVVQGDWSRREGAPVEQGATLFEIAPLDQMTVETHLRTEDLAEIEVGDSATLRVDSAFGHTWQGELTRIDPRALIVADEVVFVAEMTVDNDQQLLRPGTRASVRINTGTKPIGWLLFSQPYHWLMKKVIW